MVDFSLTNALSPMLFSADGYQVVVMPMVTDKAQKEAKVKATEQATTEAKPTEPEPVAEAQVVVEVPAKPKHSRKREKVVVA